MELYLAEQSIRKRVGLLHTIASSSVEFNNYDFVFFEDIAYIEATSGHYRREQTLVELDLASEEVRSEYLLQSLTPPGGTELEAFELKYQYLLDAQEE